MIYWLLPAYNEEENLGLLVGKIARVMEGDRRPYRIIIVDDGSRDRTAQVAEEAARTYPVTLVRHEVNKGLPQTLRTGIEYVLNIASDDDALVVMDADNTHEPSTVLPMLARLDEGNDVVIASRYYPGGKEIGLSLSRKFLSRTCNAALGLLFPMAGVSDYTCGYRLYRVGALRKADREFPRLIESTAFSCTAEILLKLGRVGAKGAEVPLVLRYDQKGGASKMKVMRTTWDYVRLVGRMWRA